MVPADTAASLLIFSAFTSMLSLGLVALKTQQQLMQREAL